jgi:CPA2 family monovalent cation:H+ antiporter-2
MENDILNLKIVLTLTIGFTLASALGFFALKAKLSPIVGYLVAGYLIGPYSPGFVANKELSEQLSEVGVILMMFSVGLHLKWQDLSKVKYIAIGGALIQTTITTFLGMLVIQYIGWTVEASFIIGLSLGVASTIVLLRLMAENNALKSQAGHIAVGWLIVEDIITVIALLLLPIIASSLSGEGFSFYKLSSTMFVIVLKFTVLALIMFTFGHECVKFALNSVIKLKSKELFTLTILALTFVIATGSTYIFGTSIALGAFIAGLVMGQTDVRAQVALSATPLRDTFIVVFFLSVGMLFNPKVIVDHFFLFLSILSIVLILKPLAALIISLLFGKSFKDCLVIAVALAQIGEFSFILTEQASKLEIMPQMGYDIIVATALVSISLNPLLFYFLKKNNLIEIQHVTKSK